MPPRGHPRGKRRHTTTASRSAPPLFEPEMAGYVTATGAMKRMPTSGPGRPPSNKRQALSSAQEGSMPRAKCIMVETPGEGITTGSGPFARQAHQSLASTQGPPPVGQYTQPRSVDQKTLSALAKLLPHPKWLLAAEAKPISRDVERIVEKILSSGSSSSQQPRGGLPSQALIEPKREDFKHLFPLVAKNPALVKLLQKVIEEADAQLAALACRKNEQP
ncbi:uncharacterized protein SCHCODRAFT_02618128 [Schizophyllum commune H4-8]|uniref:uncharacterized protein n=1 Tax=Schizophyllum commune (strain H4-8 / FGSC 9210) TaxID=578458 RepID=UPI0021610099|nr:uncharacterized protein SCHCODRAFT_02618128 [Schizophyllum commune H4-8]KAI5894933.1 hypothetical protein SCHCODRAFT_02618128 [Schizophyllum commune H4-8]